MGGGGLDATLLFVLALVGRFGLPFTKEGQEEA